MAEVRKTADRGVDGPPERALLVGVLGGARSDLLAVGEWFAADARATLDSTSPRSTLHSGRLGRAVMAVEGAKAALEAATLVDLEPPPIVAALDRLVARLGAVEVEDALVLGDPVAAIDAAADLVAHMQVEVATGAAVQHGYVALRDLALGLERDFTAADSETSRRLAARIHEGLAGAKEAIRVARTAQEER
jgi:hypothetical protein